MTPEEERRMRMQVAAILGPKAGEVVTQSAVTPEMLQAAGQSTDGQRSAIARQARTAEALRSTATPEGRSAGGIYVASNPLEHLGAIGDKAWGRKVAREVRGQEEALDQTEAEKAVGQMELEQARLADANAREDRIRREDQGFKWDLMEANRIARRQEAAEKRALERTIRQQAALTEVGEGNVEIAKGRRQRFEDFVDRSKDRMESSAKGNKPATQAEKIAQYRANTFDDGLASMNTLLGTYDPETGLYDGYDPTSLEAFWDKQTNKFDLTRFLASPEGQQWAAATETMKEAALRTATGAAAPETENTRYIAALVPSPGEDPATVRAKMQKLARFSEYMNELGGSDNQEMANRAYEVAASRLRAEDPGEGKMLEEQPEAPEVGTVQDGYRFRGGNPADPNNWEKT